MNPAISSYLAAKVLDDVRHGRKLDDELADALNKFPLVDMLTDATLEGDVPQLLDLCRRQTASVASLALGMLRKFDGRPDVRSFLIEEWNRSTAYDTRMQLLWRLLDNEQLGLEMHREIHSFVMINLDQFVADCVKWYGGAEKVLEGVQTRLADTTFPKSKGWIYLCSALGSGDRGGVTQLLESHLRTSNVEFVRQVSAELLKNHKP